MLNCHEASQLASSRMEAVLPLTKRVSLGVHLALCRHCRRFARQIERLRRVARATQTEAGAELSQEARERLRYALQQQARGTGD